MGMNKTVMANLIKGYIQALPDWPNEGQSSPPIRQDVLEALCQGIIEHIQSAMVVTSQGSNGGGAMTSTSTTVV